MQRGPKPTLRYELFKELKGSMGWTEWRREFEERTRGTAKQSEEGESDAPKMVPTTTCSFRDTRGTHNTK